MVKKLGSTLLMALIVVGGIGLVFLFYLYTKLPDPKLLESWTPPQASRVYDEKGRYYGSVGLQIRFYVPIEKIPPHVINAFVAAEDQNFWRHPGIDPLSIIRALIVNYKTGKVVQGGSTITQQLAKNLYLGPQRTLERKIKEILLAIKIERTFPKKKILELYLNQIYLGSGAYGVEAASRTYFGKHVWELSLEEAALLAGLPKAPTKYNPFYNPDEALERRNYVLKRMLEEGYISQEEYERAVNSPLKVKEENRHEISDYFLDMVRDYVFAKYEELGYVGGLTIYTTINLDFQRQAERSLKKGLSELAKSMGIPFLPESEKDMKEAYEKQKELKELKRGKVYVAKIVSYENGLMTVEIHGRELKGEIKDLSVAGHKYIFVRYLGGDKVEIIPDLEGAIVSIDAKTGEIKAIVGGRSYSYSQFNRAIKAYRQPGSAIKPVIYMGALLKGMTQISIIDASPKQYYDASRGGYWTPKNYDGRTYGNVTLRYALAQSINTAAVNLLDMIGFDVVLEVGRKVGLEDLKPYYSLALGSIEVTPLELTSAFQVFANLGVRCEPFFIKKIVAPDGRVLEENKPKCVEVLPAPETRVLVDMLRAVVLEGTATRAKGLNRIVAGKTGTTNDYKDAWFVGFSPRIVTGVWVGYDVKKSLGRGMSGARAALPIWIDYMSFVLRYYPEEDFPLPPENVVVPINLEALVIADETCSGVNMVFVRGTEPQVTCSELNTVLGQNEVGGEGTKETKEGEIIQEESPR